MDFTIEERAKCTDRHFTAKKTEISRRLKTTTRYPTFQAISGIKTKMSHHITFNRWSIKKKKKRCQIPTSINNIKQWEY